MNVEISHNTDSPLFSFQMSLYFSLLFDNKLSTICPRLVRLGVLVRGKVEGRRGTGKGRRVLAGDKEDGRFAKKRTTINKTVKNGDE